MDTQKEVASKLWCHLRIHSMLYTLLMHIYWISVTHLYLSVVLSTQLNSLSSNIDSDTDLLCDLMEFSWSLCTFISFLFRMYGIILPILQMRCKEKIMKKYIQLLPRKVMVQYKYCNYHNYMPGKQREKTQAPCSQGAHKLA